MMIRKGECVGAKGTKKYGGVNEIGEISRDKVKGIPLFANLLRKRVLSEREVQSHQNWARGGGDMISRRGGRLKV